MTNIESRIRPESVDSLCRPSGILEDALLPDNQYEADLLELLRHQMQSVQTAEEQHLRLLSELFLSLHPSALRDAVAALLSATASFLAQITKADMEFFPQTAFTQKCGGQPEPAVTRREIKEIPGEDREEQVFEILRKINAFQILEYGVAHNVATVIGNSQLETSTALVMQRAKATGNYLVFLRSHPDSNPWAIPEQAIRSISHHIKANTTHHPCTG